MPTDHALQQAGVDRAGRNGIDSNIRSSQLQGSGLGQANHSMFASGIDRDVGDARYSRAGCGVHDSPAAMRQHMRNLVLQAQPDALEIDAHDPIEIGLLQLMNRSEATFDAGIVDRGMNATQSLRGAAHDSPHLARVRHIVGDEKLTVNENKTRVQRPNSRQTVTGIVVNKRPNVARRTTKRLRAILHQARKNGLAAQNRDNRDNFVDWLGGMISYVHMVNPDKGRRLREEFAKVSG